jgi:phage replication O-like protein O
MPHLENGFVRIASELLDAIILYRIPGEQMKVFLYILRKTYGYGKKSDNIALSQFSIATGMKKPTVCRAIKGLKEKNLIVIKKDNKLWLSYSINKYYAKWKPLSKKITLSKKIITVIKKDNLSLSKKIIPYTKENTTKDNTTKDIIYRAREFEKKSTEVLNGKSQTPLFKTFIDYWTESNKSGKKLRFEDQKFFDIKKRFATFERREQKFIKNNSGTYREEGKSYDF